MPTCCRSCLDKSEPVTSIDVSACAELRVLDRLVGRSSGLSLEAS